MRYGIEAVKHTELWSNYIRNKRKCLAKIHGFVQRLTQTKLIELNQIIENERE